MTMYRLKPLVWFETTFNVRAETLIGGYIMIRVKGGYTWRACNDYGGDKKEPSLEAAKAAAEAHYIERMEQGLERVG